MFGSVKSHRFIWTFTGLIFALAVIVFALRMASDAMKNAEERKNSVEENAEAVDRMLEYLRMDPRVRRTQTRAAVEAVSVFAQETQPPSAEPHYALGLQRYYRDYDVAGAEAAFRRTVELKPEWSWGHNALGIVLFASGREDEGLAAFQEAMRLDPTWTRPFNDLAILYRRAGKMRGAVREIERALEMDPNDPVTHYNYGVILDVQGDVDAAKVQYERVLELDPDVPAAYYNLACGYARKNELEDALRYLEEAIAREEAFHEEAMRDPDFDPIRSRQDFADFMSAKGGKIP